MPKMQFRSCAKPSTYAYPPILEAPKEKEKEKVRKMDEFPKLYLMIVGSGV